MQTLPLAFPQRSVSHSICVPVTCSLLDYFSLSGTVAFAVGICTCLNLNTKTKVKLKFVSLFLIIFSAGDGSTKIRGCWDSIHVVEVQVIIIIL